MLRIFRAPGGGQVLWPLFHCGVKNDGCAVKRCKTGRAWYVHGWQTRRHTRRQSFGLFIISIKINNIISFRGQLGLSLLARNARRIGGHSARDINDIDNARTSGQIAILSLIGQGTMLIEANLIVVLVVLALDDDLLLLDLVVKVEQIFGHHVQEMRQASCLGNVALVLNCTKRALSAELH